MIPYGATFHTYEVIAICNMNLNDNSIVKVIKIESIVVEAIVRGKINRICNKDAFHVHKLQAQLLLVSKLVSNDLKVQFNLNE